MPILTRAELDRLILRTIEDQHEAARAEPEPPKWQWWSHGNWELDRAYNRRYSPTWFGPVAAGEAGRVRVLRRVREMAAAGLLVIHRGDAGRLERVTLPEAGLAELGEGEDGGQEPRTAE